MQGSSSPIKLTYIYDYSKWKCSVDTVLSLFKPFFIGALYVVYPVGLFYRSNDGIHGGVQDLWEAQAQAHHEEQGQAARAKGQ